MTISKLSKRQTLDKLLKSEEIAKISSLVQITRAMAAVLGDIHKAGLYMDDITVAAVEVYHSLVSIKVVTVYSSLINTKVITVILHYSLMNTKAMALTLHYSDRKDNGMT